MGFQASLLFRNFITILFNGPVSLVSYKIILRSLAQAAVNNNIHQIIRHIKLCENIGTLLDMFYLLFPHRDAV